MFIKFSFLLLAWLAATNGSPFGCGSCGSPCDESPSWPQWPDWWQGQQQSWWPSSWGQQSWPSWGQQSWPSWGQQSWPSWGQQSWPSWGQSWPNWGQSWPNWGQSWPYWGQSSPSWSWSWSDQGNFPWYPWTAAAPEPVPQVCGTGPWIEPPSPPSPPTPPPIVAPTPPSPDDYQLGGPPASTFSAPKKPVRPTRAAPTGSWADFVKSQQSSGLSRAAYGPKDPVVKKPLPATFVSKTTRGGNLIPELQTYISQSRAPRNLWWAIYYCFDPQNMFTSECECLWANIYECYYPLFQNPQQLPHPLCQCNSWCDWW